MPISLTVYGLSENSTKSKYNFIVYSITNTSPYTLSLVPIDKYDSDYSKPFGDTPPSSYLFTVQYGIEFNDIKNLKTHNPVVYNLSLQSITLTLRFVIARFHQFGQTALKYIN